MLVHRGGSTDAKSPTASPNRYPDDTDAAPTRLSVLGSVDVAFGRVLADCTAEAGEQPAAMTVIDETAKVQPGQYAAFEFGSADPGGRRFGRVSQTGPSTSKPTGRLWISSSSQPSIDSTRLSSASSILAG